MGFRIGRDRFRRWGAPDARLRTLAGAAERLELWTEKVCRLAQPLVSKLYAVRRRLATGAVTLAAVWLFVHVIFGANGMAVYRAKRAEYQTLGKEIERLERGNERYAGEIDQLKTDPRRIEKEAREQFHYARPGEVIYVSPQPALPQPDETHSAHK
jgi:cell division protein FtsB